MLGIDGIHVLRPACMAGEAARIDLFRGVIREDKYFGFVSTTGDVRRTGSVTSFTSLMRRPALCIESCFPMRALLPAVVNVLVASFACF